MMNVIRNVLSALILAWDRLFQARAEVVRSADAQARVDEETRKLSLYEFAGCPFCVKARRGAARLGLRIERKDVRREERYAAELLAGGGEYQVPCLRIDEGEGKARWLYESSDILEYLEKRFRSA